MRIQQLPGTPRWIEQVCLERKHFLIPLWFTFAFK
jgi:hypothetical protein